MTGNIDNRLMALGHQIALDSYADMSLEEEFTTRDVFGHRRNNPTTRPDVINIHPYLINPDGTPTEMLVTRLKWGLMLLNDYCLDDVIVSGISGPPGSLDHDYVQRTGITEAAVCETWLRDYGFKGLVHRLDVGNNTFETLAAIYGEIIPQYGFEHVEETSTFEHLARIRLQGIQHNEMAGRNVKRTFSGPKIRNPAQAVEFMLWELTTVHTTLGYTAADLTKADR